MAYRETDRIRERKRLQRQRLLDAGEQLVRQGGFAGLTMQALARTSGVGVGTLYRYFASKDALAVELFRRATEREIQAVERAMARPGEASRVLCDVVRTFAERALRAPRLAWALIAEPVDPGLDQERLAYRAAWAERFRGLLERGMHQGDWPPQDAGLVASALVGAMAEALVGPLAEAPTPSLIEPLTRFCLRAVGGSHAEQESAAR